MLLRTIYLQQRGGVGEGYTLKLDDEWEANPVLAQLLSTDFGVEIDGDQVEGALTDLDTTDASPAFAILSNAAAEVPAFSIEPRLVVGTFSYAKLPMVADL